VIRLNRIGLRATAVVVLALAATSVVEAQLSPADRSQAEAMVAGRLYLRVDAPCDYGRMVPLLVVSPDKADAMGRIADLSQENLEAVYWYFGPNDALQHAVLRWGIKSVRVWADGAIRDNEVMIDFVGIKTLDDFEKAFARTFSKVPLQDEHPEWESQLRTAVAGRRLVLGMTKEQAAAVVGTPTSIETSTADGVELETWRPRQANGVTDRYRGENTLTRFPVTLEFQGGKLTKIEAAPSSAVPRKR